MLESSLHQNLLEHINSEIGMGAITDVAGAKAWLRHSFLRQRIERNPAHYHIGKTAGQSWEEKLDDMVTQSIKKLEKNELIKHTGDDEGGEGLFELFFDEGGELVEDRWVGGWEEGGGVAGA